MVVGGSAALMAHRLDGLSEYSRIFFYNVLHSCKLVLLVAKKSEKIREIPAYAKSYGRASVAKKENLI